MELWIVHCSMDWGECAYEIICDSEEVADRVVKREEDHRSDSGYLCSHRKITLDPKTGEYD